MGQEIKKTIKGKIVFKQETEANWAQSNYVPDNGEMVIYDVDDSHNYKRVKYGDGETKVRDLPFGGATFDDNVTATSASIGIINGAKISANVSLKVGEDDDFNVDNYGNLTTIGSVTATGLSSSNGLTVTRGSATFDDGVKIKGQLTVTAGGETETTLSNDLIATDGTMQAMQGIYSLGPLRGKSLEIQNNIVLNEGVAEGNTSIAGGTTDKSFITELVGEAGNLLTLNPSEAKGACSIALGADNKAIVGGAVAMGYKNTSGGNALRTAGIIDSYSLLLYDTEEHGKGNGTADWQAGDKVLVINDDEYILTVEKVDNTGVVTFKEKLPFISLVKLTTLSKPNERTACNITRLDSEGNHYKIGQGAFSIGVENVSTGSGALAFGYKNKAAGDFGVAFGQENISGYSAFSAGIGNQALAKASTAFGDQTTASGINAFSAGEDTVASGRNSVALGNDTKANGTASVAEGFGTITEDANTHAEGYKTKALKEGAHSEGKETIASAKFAHTEGEFTVASARAAHAEGAKFEALDNKDNVVATYTNEASGEGSHVEGCGTKATA